MFELHKQSVEYENKSLRLPKELIEKVQLLADEYNMSFNKVVIECVEYALNNMKPNEE
jgi:predicted DNA-binding protein